MQQQMAASQDEQQQHVNSNKDDYHAAISTRRPATLYDHPLDFQRASSGGLRSCTHA